MNEEQTNNPIDDAAFDEILKSNNIQAPNPVDDAWSGFSGLEDNFGERLGKRISTGQQEIDAARELTDTGIEMRYEAGAQGKGSTMYQKFANDAKSGVNSLVSPVAATISELVSTARAAQKAKDDEAIANGDLEEKDALSRRPKLEDELGSFIGSIMEKLKASREETKAKGGGPDLIDMFNNASPEVQANLGATKDIGLAGLDAALALEGGGLLRQGAKKIVEKAPKAAAATVDAAKSTVTAAKGLKTKAANIGKDRSSAELAKLTEADMAKMSAGERQEFVRLKKEGLANAEKAAKETVNKQLAADIEVSKKEITNLQKEVGNVSADKTEALKPKVIEGIKKQSDTYAKIVEEELAPVRDTMVSPAELKTYINSRINPNDPTSVARAQKIVDTLKLEGEGAQATTVGGLYDNAKALKQQISKTSKTGSKVFSPEEMEVMDSVAALSDFMKDKGVDLTRANDFWKSWAPVRDQIMTKMRPFDVTGTRGGGFAKLLQRVSEGKADKFNANFIKQVEDLVGEPITAETKAVVEKLTASQKAQVAKKMAAEEVKFEAKLAKEQATSKLSKEAYDAKTFEERKVWYKSTFAKILGLVGAGAAVKGGYDLFR